MEEEKEFDYLLSNGEKEGGINEKVVKWSSVLGALARVMNARNEAMEVKRGWRNSNLPPVSKIRLRQGTGHSSHEYVL